MWGHNESTAAPARAPELEREARVVPEPGPVLPARPAPSLAAPAAGRSVIGRGLVLKGQVNAGEDLYIDGEVEGSIEVKDHDLTVGASGRVKANVVARNVYIAGTLHGDLKAGQKIVIRHTGSLLGDLVTAGVTIEDGAYFKGGIDIVKPGVDGKAKTASG